MLFYLTDRPRQQRQTDTQQTEQQHSEETEETDRTDKRAGDRTDKRAGDRIDVFNVETNVFNVKSAYSLYDSYLINHLIIPYVMLTFLPYITGTPVFLCKTHAYSLFNAHISGMLR